MKDAANVIPVAPLFYRNLQMSLSGALDVNYQSYEAQVDLSQRGIGVVGQPHEELEWENPLEERDRPPTHPSGDGSSLPGPED